MSEAQNALACVAEEIARLRDHYVARLPAELAELEKSADGLQGAENDRPALEALRHRLHRLAGSAGTFGLSMMGQQARRLENLAEARLAGAQSAAAGELASFKDGVRALSTYLTQADTGQPMPEMASSSADTASATRIWFVEADAQLGPPLAQAMQQFGYAVRLFADLAAARDAIAGGRPDVLIMDGLPPQSGEAAIRALDCPILFISAEDDFAARAHAARLDAVGFLHKPVDVPRLVDRLERIFEQRRAPSYRVLIVDDDVALSEHFCLALRAAGMEADVLNRPEQIIDRVADFRPELILMDVNMPEHSGPELATVIRHHDEWIGLPIVFLSAETDPDRQLAALGHGGDDFITKPISDAQLVAAVRVRAARSRQLADLMSKDSLTGLLKHSRIKEELEAEFVRARRSGKPFSAAMLDIDHFKSVNDTYGHATGDRVIKAVAHLLRQRLRKSDIVGRYGGEEFAAILPECDEQTAYRILDDLRVRFSLLRFSHDGEEFSCALSAGVACSKGYAGQNGAGLLAGADAALYAAKRSGRNQVRIADIADLS